MRAYRLPSIVLFVGVAILLPEFLLAQIISGAATQATNEVRTVAMAVGTLIAGIVGVIGVGRTSYKLGHGETDSINAMLGAVAGVALGATATAFL